MQSKGKSYLRELSMTRGGRGFCRRGPHFCRTVMLRWNAVEPKHLDLGALAFSGSTRVQMRGMATNDKQFKPLYFRSLGMVSDFSPCHSIKRQSLFVRTQDDDRVSLNYQTWWCFYNDKLCFRRDARLVYLAFCWEVKRGCLVETAP